MTDLAFEDGCLVTLRSAHDFETTWHRLQEAVINQETLSPIAHVDYQATLVAQGLDARPNRVMWFDNASLSSQFICTDARAGLDLPFRIQVYVSDDMQTVVAYEDPVCTARRYRLDQMDMVLTHSAEMLRSLAASAIRN